MCYDLGFRLRARFLGLDKVFSRVILGELGHLGLVFQQIRIWILRKMEWTIISIYGAHGLCIGVKSTT